MTYESEIEELRQSIPFPIPYITAFDNYGNIEIAFNHKVESRIDLKQLVDSGLLSIDLINEQLDIAVQGSPKQPL